MGKLRDGEFLPGEKEAQDLAKRTSTQEVFDFLVDYMGGDRLGRALRVTPNDVSFWFMDIRDMPAKDEQRLRLIFRVIHTMMGYLDSEELVHDLMWEYNKVRGFNECVFGLLTRGTPDQMLLMTVRQILKRNGHPAGRGRPEQRGVGHGMAGVSTA